MRILHVVTAFPRTPDDVIVPWLVELLKRLQAAGHDVEVFTSSYRGAPDQVFAGIPVHRFRYFPRRWENLTHEEAAPDRMKRSLLYRLMPACFVLAGMVAIWRLCRRARYDVIHVHWPLPLALFGWAAQRARPARLVTTFYGVELRWVKSALPFLKGFLAWAARRSDRVVAISHYTAGELRELADVPSRSFPTRRRFQRWPRRPRLRTARVPCCSWAGWWSARAWRISSRRSRGWGLSGHASKSWARGPSVPAWRRWRSGWGWRIGWCSEGRSRRTSSRRAMRERRYACCRQCSTPAGTRKGSASCCSRR